LNKPTQRLVSRWASLTVAFAAAVVLAACGGGSTDSLSSTGGDLSPRIAKVVGTVETAQSVDMKVLVISAVGTAPSFAAATSILDQIGVPYDKIVLKGATPTALQLVAGTLSDGAGHGKYQGIILETGDLPYEETTKCAALGFSSPCYPSALTAAQWAMLRQYQYDFGVRSATMYTRASLTPDSGTGVQLDLTYGLTPVSGRNTNDYTTPPDLPVTASLTPTNGVSVFSYLNPANPVIVKNAYTYLSTAVAGTQTLPLLTATEGGTTYAIASVYTAPSGATTVGVAPGGWENLAISADNNPELTHSLLLGYGVVNWVTKGVFLGERKVYMTAQPDDVFIPDDLWDPVSNTTPNNNTTTGYVSNPIYRYRNTGNDYTSLVAWQTAFQAKPNMAAFRLEIPFNGVGYNTTDSDYLNQGEVTDTLSQQVRANPNAFRWINHTWDHSSLQATDPEPSALPYATPTVASITNQLTWNHEVATGLRSGNPNVPAAPKVTFANYVKGAFIQPDISGLENPVFWTAAKTFGLRYILMDTSKAYAGFIPARPAVAPIPPNTGYTSSLDSSSPKIIIIPRYPTNLFYNNSTPDEWVSEYNFLYASKPPAQGGIGYISNYTQVLNQESDVLVRYMLKYHVNSWMFHAANLRAYPGGTNQSVLGDLLNAVANKYAAMYNLPVLSPSQAEIGEIMKARMAYNAAVAGGLKGKIVYGPTASIELANPSGVSVVVPMTGVAVNGTPYGGQPISTFALAPSGTTTFAAPTGLTVPRADLSVAITSSTSTPVQGGTLTYSTVITNTGPFAVAGSPFVANLPAGLGAITNVVSQLSAGASVSSLTTTTNSLAGLVSLPVGGQGTVTYQVTVSPTATGTLTTTASVNEPADMNALNNTATQAVRVGLADLSSSVILPANALAGSVVTGTVTFSNANGAVSNASGVAIGTAVTATAVTGTVTLTGGQVRTFTVASLAPGATNTRTFTATMPLTLGTPLIANSTVATVTPESNTANNGSSATTGPYADPGVSVNSIPGGTPGSTVQATVNLSNTAGQTAVTFTPQIVVNNGTPFNLAPVTLAAGQSATSAVINVPAGGTVTANVTLPSVADSNLTNNSDTKVSGVLYAELSSTVLLPASAPAGSVVSGTVTFTNDASAGTAALAVTGGVTLSNGDAKTFTVGTLTPGQSSVQTFTTTVGTTTLSATSTVSTTTLESNTANNTSTASMAVTSPSTPTPTPDPVPPVVAAPEPLPATGGGGGGCTTSPEAQFDPLLWMMLLAGGVATGLRRRRTADIETDRH
jgi:hypothetical protein